MATDTQVVRNTGIGSLRLALWRQYVSSRTDEPAEIALSKLKFLKDDRHGALRATVDGVLLLLAADDAREWLPNAWSQAVCYGGDRMDAGRQLDARDVAGPLDEQIRVEKLLAIGERCAKRLAPGPSAAEHGDLLYDERGLPK